jgi:hypothetical protein
LRPVFDLAREAIAMMGDTHPTLFLSPTEVEALTGFKSHARQCRWLHVEGWRFVISGNGKPVVARKYAEKMLGCAGDDQFNPAPTPNFGALLRAV